MLPQQEPIMTPGCCRCSPRAATQSRRSWDIVTGGFSLGIWILLPKCPVCLAAYLALWTGLGLSFTQAAYVRGLLLCLSVMLLCFLVVKYTLKAGAMAHARH